MAPPSSIGVDLGDTRMPSVAAVLTKSGVFAFGAAVHARMANGTAVFDGLSLRRPCAGGYHLVFAALSSCTAAR